MADKDQDQNVETGQNQDTSYDELSLDGQGFSALEDAEDNSLVNQQDPLQEDAVQNANVQGSNRHINHNNEGAAEGQQEVIQDDVNIIEDDFRIERLDDNVNVDFENIQPAFNSDEEGDDDEEAASQADIETLIDPTPEDIENPAPVFEGDGGESATGATFTSPTTPEFIPTPIPAREDDEIILEAQGRTLEIDIQNGVEDNRLLIDIDILGGDGDGGSETVVITIENVPDGFSFQNAAGVAVGKLNGNIWTFTPDELKDLYAVPGEHYSGDQDWNITATVTETTSGDVASTTETISVHFEAVADQAPLSVSDSAGMENTWIDVDINSALVDADGSETIAIYVADAPDGVTFNAGEKLTSAVTLDDGTVLDAGTWVFSTDDLDSLQVRSPDNVSDDFDLRVYSETTEGANNDKALNGPKSIHVDVGIVDPTVSASGGGDERTWIDLDLDASINAADGTEQMVVYLEDLPEGAQLRYVHNETLLIPDSDGRYVVTGDLDNLQVRWGDSYTGQSDADITFDLRAVVTDVDAGSASDTPLGDAVAPDTSETVSTVTVNVDIVTGEATLDVSGSGTEDIAMALDIDATLIDTDGSETITSYMIEDVPDGFTFQNAAGDPVGSKGADGNWTIAPDDIEGLHVKAPQHYSGDSDWTINVNLQEHDGSTAVISKDFTVHFEAVADQAPLSVSDSAGMENTWIDVDINSALVDADGSETIAIYVADAPDGVTFNAGEKLTSAVTLDDGTVLDAGTWVFSTDDLDTLQVRSPDNVSADFDLRVYSETTEGANNDKALNGPKSIHVDVGIVDPTVSGSASGGEDQWIALDLEAEVNAADGSETLSLYIEGLPDGVDVRYVDTKDPVPLVDGRYDISGNIGNIEVRWNQTTHAHSEEDFSFQLRAVVTDVDAGTANDTPLGDAVAPDTSESVTTVEVDVKAIADKANITAKAVGVEDQWLDFDLDISLKDTDGSESITSIIISGVPDGVELNNGTEILDASNQPTGKWSLELSDLDDLKIKPVDDSNENFQLKVSVTTQEQSDGDDVATKTTTTNKNVTVQIFGDADLPTVDVISDPKLITEDQFFNLRSSFNGEYAVDGDLSEAGSADQASSQDGSEALTFRITPQESGARLAISSDGNISSDELVDLPAEGYWTVSAQDVFDGKVYVGGAENWSSANGAASALHFDVQAVATEDDANVDDSALDGTGLSREGVAISDSETLTLVVTPDADGTHISGNASGNEDQSGGIRYQPTITMIDSDGSEELTGNVVITSSDSDLLAGELKLNGNTLTPTDNGDGTYSWEFPVSSLTSTGTAGQYKLTDLYFFPEEHNANDVNLTITVTTTETATGDPCVTTSNGKISVRAIADAPNVQVNEADASGVVTGTEDTYIDLGLDAQLVDTDGSEELTKFHLYDVEDGWEVGYLDGSGDFTSASDKGSYWDLDGDKLDQVVVRAPADTHTDSGVTMKFKVYSTEQESGWQVKTKEASTTQEFTVKVVADADTPSVITKNASGLEDTQIELEIRPALGTDTDGSESLSVLLENIPDGAAFYNSDGDSVGQRVSLDGSGNIVADANGDYWYFENGDWEDLFVQPPEDSNEDFDINVIARTTEASNGDYAEATSTLHVDVIGDADQPNVGDGPVVITGDEDSEINPDLAQFASKDTDGSESMSVVISDIPNGVDVYMSAGNEDYMSYIGNGKWSVDADHLDDVRMSTSKDFAGTKELTVKFISTENDGDVNALTRTVQLTIEAEADKPVASIGASVIEDSASIELNITAKPSDLTSESPEEITRIVINVDESGLPSGTELKLVYNGQTYDVSASGDDLVINVDANTAGYDSASGKLEGVVLEGVPTHWSKDIPITMSVEATDVDGSTATKDVTSKVRITADADPLETFEISDSVTGTSGTDVSLGLNVAYADSDGSEQAYLVVENVPNGASLNMGFSIGNGMWIVPGDADLNTLAFRSDYSGTVTLDVRAVVVDSDPDSGSDRYEMDPISVDVQYNATGGGEPGWDTNPWGADPAAPDVSSTISAVEDQNFNLNDLTMTVNEPGASASAIVITNLPAGASISGAYYNPVDGSWVVPYDERANVSIKPPADFSGEMQADIAVVSVEDGVAVSSANSTIVIADVAPVTDGGRFSGGAATGSDLNEDGGVIDLDLTLSQLDDDLSEGMTADQVTISNVPDGATLYLNGVELTPDVNGEYVLDVGSIDGQSSLDIDGLSIRPPANFDGNISLQLETTFQDQTGAPKTVSGSVSLDIEAVADQADLTAQDVNGTEDQLISLDLNAYNPDVTGQYGSEHMSVVIGNVPDGAVIIGATNNDDGTWTVKNANIDFATGDISNVKLLAPRNFSGTLSLELKAYSIENSNDAVAESTVSFNVDVVGVADTPDIDPSAVSGVEDSEIALVLNEQLGDASETLYVTVSDVPGGAGFTDGNGNTIGVEVKIDSNGQPVLDANNQPVPVDNGTSSGAWYFTAAQVSSGVFFVTAAHASGIYTMNAVATSVDGDSVAHSLLEDFNVSVTGQADTPILSIGDLTDALDGFHAVGNEDQSGGIALDISASLVDTDGSETLQVILTGAPDGTTFVSNGVTISVNAQNQWIVDADQLADLHIVAPENYNGSFQLNVEARSEENGTTATQTAQLDVNIEAVNDAPELSLANQDQGLSGLVAEPITILPDAADAGLQLGITDVDGNELSGMTIQITDGVDMGDSLGLHGVDVTLGTSGNLLIDGTDISVSYDQATASLSFQGAADHDTYASLAEKVVFTNSTGQFEGGERTFTINVYDDAGSAGTLETTTTISNDGAQLSSDAMAGVNWGINGVTMTGGAGDEQFIINFGDVNSINGGGGDDTLFLRGSAGEDGDWLFNIDEDGSMTLTSASDSDLSGFISLDNGTLNQDETDAHNIIFDGDASGKIEFEGGEIIEFTDLDKVSF